MAGQGVDYDEATPQFVWAKRFGFTADTDTHLQARRSIIRQSISIKINRLTADLSDEIGRPKNATKLIVQINYSKLIRLTSWKVDLCISLEILNGSAQVEQFEAGYKATNLRSLKSGLQGAFVVLLYAGKDPWKGHFSELMVV